jgi:hypothetical protein
MNLGEGARGRQPLPPPPIPLPQPHKGVLGKAGPDGPDFPSPKIWVRDGILIASHCMGMINQPRIPVAQASRLCQD